MYYIRGGVYLILNTDGTKPIYVQIAEWLEIEILSGSFERDQKVYSQYQLADIFNINPATAAKGLNILVDGDVLYKKRGLGMFVSGNARERILNKRKKHTLKKLVQDLVVEGERLSISEEEVFDMIKNVKRNWEGK